MINTLDNIEYISHLFTNIAPEGIASQSSLSEWSTENDAQGAINGIKTGRFGFHTRHEKHPWWEVDLRSIRKISAIAIFNREDTAQERSQSLILTYSSDGSIYHPLLATSFVFGGILSNKPFVLRLAQPLEFRYFRIILNDTNYFHLDQVEIYSSTPAPGFIKNPLDGEHHYSLDEIDEALKVLTHECRFDDALKLIYAQSESEPNPTRLDRWYLKMVDIARIAHKQGAYRPQTLLFRSRWGGLCNRLFSLATAYSHSQVLGIELKICWTTNPECPALLENLTALPGISMLDVAGSLELSSRQGAAMAWTGAFGIDGKIYDLFPLTPAQKQSIAPLTKRFIQNLAFTPAIHARVLEFMNYQDWDSSITGVHFRGTDHTAFFTDQGMADKLSTIDGFNQRMQSLIDQGQQRFFLATDAVEAYSKFSETFGDRIFMREKFHDADQFRQTSIEDALIDLILLSKTQKIVGSKLSTFGYFASILGNIPLLHA